jgi:hypothetical protein
MPEQAQALTHIAYRPMNALGELLLSQMLEAHDLGHGTRLVHRREVFAMQVFQELHNADTAVECADEDGDLLHAGPACGVQPAGADDEAVGAVGPLHQERLEDSLVANARGQLLQPVLPWGVLVVTILPYVVGAGLDVVNVHEQRARQRALSPYGSL